MLRNVYQQGGHPKGWSFDGHAGLTVRALDWRLFFVTLITLFLKKKQNNKSNYCT